MNILLLKQGISFFAKHSARIEVQRKNKVELVFFFKIPYTLNLPKERKVEFGESVNRESAKSKLNDFIMNLEDFNEVCKHETNI